MNDYPEHEKLSAIKEQKEAVQEFIDWLFDEQGWWIAEYLQRERYEDDAYGVAQPTGEFYQSDTLTPVWMSREKMMAAFFGIDLVKLEAEKRHMLEEIRRAQEVPSGD